MKVKKLDTQIAAMGQTVNKLKKDRETSQRDVEKLQGDLTKAVQTIKVRKPPFKKMKIPELKCFTTLQLLIYELIGK